MGIFRIICSKLRYFVGLITSEHLLIGEFEYSNLNVVYQIPTVISCTWEKPDVRWFMLNTDGSLNNNEVGIGAIIRDDCGNVVVAVAVAGSVVPSTIIVHELEAVEAGLKLARDKGVRKLVIGMDSTTVVYLWKSRASFPWHVVQILRRIEASRTLFEEVRVKHVYMEANRTADHLSKMLPTAEYVKVVESSFAEDLKKIVFNDKSGTFYHRL